MIKSLKNRRKQEKRIAVAQATNKVRKELDVNVACEKYGIPVPDDKEMHGHVMYQSKDWGFIYGDDGWVKGGNCKPLRKPHTAGV